MTEDTPRVINGAVDRDEHLAVELWPCGAVVVVGAAARLKQRCAQPSPYCPGDSAACAAWSS